MDCLRRIGTAALAGALMFGCSSADEHADEPAHDQATKVLMIVPEGDSEDLEYMLTMEVDMMKRMLEDEGIEVHVATASGEPLTAEETTLTPDLEYGEVDVAAFDGIAMPCLAVPVSARELPAQLEEGIREAASAGIPVAAQTGAIRVLGRLGMLTEKRFSYLEEPAANIPEFEGAILTGDGIVADGNIITSAICPYAARERELEDGTAALMEAFIAQLTHEH